MIQINPLQRYIDGGARAALTEPPSASLVFDLPGKAIWVKGVKLKGTDHTYTFSHDNYITLTNTPGSNESEDILIGVDITTLKPLINSWRPIQINGSEKLGEATNTGALNFVAGTGIEISWDSTNKKLQITNSETSHTHKFKLGSTVIETAAPGTADNALTATTVITGPFGISATSESGAFSILGPSIPNYRRVDHWVDTSKYHIQYKSNYIAPILEMSVLAQSSDNNAKKTFTVRLTLDNSTNINNNLIRGAFYPSSAGGQLGTSDRYWYQVHAAYFMKNGSNDTYVLLGGGGHKAWGNSSNNIPVNNTTLCVDLNADMVDGKHASDFLLLSQWNIEVDKASFSLTREWTDSEIDLQSLSPGPCLLYINYCGVHYTGTFAYSGNTINTDDEFPLHQCGYTQLGRGRIYAKIGEVSGTTKLLLAALTPETSIPLFTIKIKQIAIL